MESGSSHRVLFIKVVCWCYRVCATSWDPSSSEEIRILMYWKICDNDCASSNILQFRTFFFSTLKRFCERLVKKKILKTSLSVSKLVIYLLLFDLYGNIDRISYQLIICSCFFYRPGTVSWCFLCSWCCECVQAWCYVGLRAGCSGFFLSSVPEWGLKAGECVILL